MTQPQNTVRLRHAESLYHALGPLISDALVRPDVVEVMANPDGSLWVDRAGVGREKLGRIEASAAETTIRLLASHMGETVTPDRPSVAGVLPRSGERFQGLLPPLAERPVFAIRKRATVIITLDDYVARGILSAGGADVIRRAVIDKKNILVAGGTGSGKTTLVNAILAEPAFRNDRVVIIEDTKELQCPAEDKVELLTKSTEPRVTMTDLLRMTLRLRPDRIIIGEVRGPEALAMLKAWNTGHPGGVATIHANSAADALRRIEDLVGEASQIVPKRSIASAVNLLVFIERISANPGRTVRSILEVQGFDGGDYVFHESTNGDR
ncbi:MAG TPA: P-type conjugative transfer ATPase TrbB [Bradyrhizobium sp.]|nr:P-type conjugative transfer ATPase TrbB [Bradyrhizobium sp.]